MGRQLDAPGDTKDRVIAHLRANGHDSISGVSRAVSQGRDRPMHRLTVAGYLEALTDVGILKEVNRPPSRMYQLQEPDAHKTLHQRAWRAVTDFAPGPDAPLMLLATLQKLLQRPLFQAELKHAGVDLQLLQPLPRTTIGDEERRHYKRALGKGTHHLDIPARDPLLGLEAGELAARAGPIEEVLRRMLLDTTGATGIRGGRPEPGEQASLHLEELE